MGFGLCWCGVIDGEGWRAGLRGQNGVVLCRAGEGPFWDGPSREPVRAMLMRLTAIHAPPAEGGRKGAAAAAAVSPNVCALNGAPPENAPPLLSLHPLFAGGNLCGWLYLHISYLMHAHALPHAKHRQAPAWHGCRPHHTQVCCGGRKASPGACHPPVGLPPGPKAPTTHNCRVHGAIRARAIIDVATLAPAGEGVAHLLEGAGGKGGAGLAQVPQGVGLACQDHHAQSRDQRGRAAPHGCGNGLAVRNNATQGPVSVWAVLNATWYRVYF